MGNMDLLHLNEGNAASKFDEMKVPANLFGSRTYTSPDCFDSSVDQYPKNNCNSKVQKSRVSKMKSDKSIENFSMLRNIVDKIDDPEKRKILLNFLDQSSFKTEYVTVKESSSSGEQAKVVRKNAPASKGRRLSPHFAMDKDRLQCDIENYIASSQERKRFSVANRNKGQSGYPYGQHFRNFAIGRKHASERGDAKVDDH
jgi:hypothetical protein